MTVRFLDSIVNIFTGQGLTKGKSQGVSYAFAPMNPMELEAAYRGSWLARKVIDIPAMDMCREWRDWQAENEEIEAIEAEEKRLNVQGKVLEAKIKARLYGGAAMFIGDGSANQSEELRPERMKNGGLKYLPVLTCQRLAAGELETDVASPWYGTPKVYTLQTDTGAQVIVHPSRLVRFIGAPLPNSETAVSTSWGDSILEAVSRALKDAEAVATNVAEMTHEAKLDVIKIPNLTAMAADPDYEARLTKRVATSMMIKGLYNTLVMDAEEEYEQKQLTFATLPDVIDRFMQIAAGAADIPMTRLLGQSPAGMNSTGESDLRNYYDRISAGQEIELRPAMSVLDECLIWSALGNRPKEIHYRWSPLWQMSEKDAAEVAMKKAQAFQIDVNSGMFPDSALSKARVNQVTEDGLYPGIEAAMDEAEAEGDAIDFSEKATAAEEAARAAQQAPGDVTRMQAAENDAAPRTLYVRRDVVNTAEITAWAKSQGFETTLPADDLHVTVIHTRTPMDWIKVGSSTEWGQEDDGRITIAPGGPRLMEEFGEAVVLQFASSRLAWRHEDIVRMGAQVDHPEFQPHITITWNKPEGMKLADVEPYRGRIVLGPEIFSEVDDNWREKVTEA
ncbi:MULTISPECIES: anti-CBASS protein Acb1 family protein [unclassified Aurantimonas]|uniref:anti-CBASS protein Acb1 family protein n=1 Tax=unclassified Aurantimonas TaxID=2638230 RepID=UPI002E182C7E|nr:MULTISPECIES: anti-CBASS Acb1 family protein [unclassified Aurantimonas]MEC5289399.1 anti-CBASS Acb1 family protein [Aurantimonas sp. C2-3-R2]MEC5410479.1 anti-CBASS Acb1 family protein [Aurantimonas sp. C2-4-R8]